MKAIRLHASCTSNGVGGCAGPGVAAGVGGAGLCRTHCTSSRASGRRRATSPPYTLGHDNGGPVREVGIRRTSRHVADSASSCIRRPRADSAGPGGPATHALLEQHRVPRYSARTGVAEYLLTTHGPRRARPDDAARPTSPPSPTRSPAYHAGREALPPLPTRHHMRRGRRRSWAHRDPVPGRPVVAPRSLSSTATRQRPGARLTSAADITVVADGSQSPRCSSQGGGSAEVVIDFVAEQVRRARRARTASAPQGRTSSSATAGGRHLRDPSSRQRTNVVGNLVGRVQRFARSTWLAEEPARLTLGTPETIRLAS